MNDILSLLIWVQTVCKGNQKTTKTVASKQTVKKIITYSGSLQNENIPMLKLVCKGTKFLFKFS